VALIAALAALVAASLLFGRRSGGACGAGAVLVALAAAAYAASATTPLPGAPPREPPAAVLQVNAALLLAGLLVAGGAAARALLAERSPATVLGAALVAAAAVAAGPRIVQAGGPAVVAAVVVAAAGAGLGAAAVRLARFVRRARAPAGPSPHAARAVPGGMGGPAVAVAAGSALAVLAPHAGLLAAGVLGAVWGGHLLARRRGLARLPVAPLLVSLLVAAVLAFVRVVMRGEGMALVDLAGGPFSVAAQAYLAPAAALAAWTSMGLWPFHRAAPGALLAPVGAAFLGRLAVPAFTEGFAHWETVLAPAAVLAVWHAALARRPGLALAALCFLGLAAQGRGMAVWLPLSLAAALAEATGRGLVPERARGAAVWTAAAGAAWGGLAALEAALRAEATYTLAAAAGAALGALLLAPQPAAAEW
jgi:hypothetical protein